MEFWVRKTWVLWRTRRRISKGEQRVFRDYYKGLLVFFETVCIRKA